MAKIITSSFLYKCKKYWIKLRVGHCHTLVFRGDGVGRCDEAAEILVPNYLFFGETFADAKEKLQLIEDFKVVEGFLSESEESSLIRELEPQLSKMRYETGHWDNAIKGYRETEKLNWNSVNAEIIGRVKKVAFTSDSVPLKSAHVLDLAENGVIMPHVDSVKFCGSTIAGMSLLSDSVMRLTNERDHFKVFDVLLKRRSLYVLSGVARYSYSHEILGNDRSIFKDQHIKKQRRISIICRIEP